MRWRVFAVAMFAFGSYRILCAQAAPAPTLPDPATFGTVIGHVFLPESNLPARFANVALQPVDMQPQLHIGGNADAKMPITVVPTGLDGGFRLDAIPAGDYYVVVNLPGYLSPIAQFTEAQLKQPSPEIQQKIAATVPMVSVSPNGVASADIRLFRGASICGVVRFDDGSPNPVARLSLLQRGGGGNWGVVQSSRSVPIEFDGRFCVEGLMAGAYRLQLSISFMQQKVSSAVGWVTNSSSKSNFSLTFFSGDTTVASQAKVLTLKNGEALNGQDITIPVSRLHALSGSVIDARTGQALNAGSVALVNADGNVAASVSIDVGTRTFNFDFAPEGEYKLRINDAREAQYEPPPTDARPGTRTKEKVLRAYNAGEVALILHSDTSGVTIPVQLKSETGIAAR